MLTPWRELIFSGFLTLRWYSWLLVMPFFLFMIRTSLVGLAAATNAEADPNVKGQIRSAQV